LLVVHLPSGRSPADGRAILQRLLAGTRHEALANTLSDDARVRWLVARFPFSSLVSWKDALSSQNARNGVTGIDADELRNVVTVFVSDAGDIAAVGPSAGCWPSSGSRTSLSPNLGRNRLAA
jgi:hypothetical protein